ncbi:MAG: lactate utilization protein C [Planctomycetaceae bacterium]
MSAAKTTILSAIRRHHLAEAPLPSLDQEWIQFSDASAQFASVLESVGGRAILVADTAELNSELSALSAWRDAKKTVSLIEGVDGNTDLAQIDDPHATEDIDFAILPGQFAVAENGAVWVTDDGIKQRAIYFIAQHLALVVSADDIVPNMHAAYRRLSFDLPRFGAFISGPSKTADIEQSLVIGAHGPRSMTVFVVTSSAPKIV